MTELSLMRRDDAIRFVAFKDEAVELRDLALQKSALIGKVTNPDEQQAAVEAQASLHTLRQVVEKERQALKAPVLDFGRKIDATAKSFVEEVDSELLRLAQMIGDFQALEQAKVRAAESAKNDSLSQLERDRATEIAAAKTHDEIDAINQKYSEKAALLHQSPAAQPARAEGQIVKPDWNVTVTDIWLLARAHSACVKIEPRLSEIKALLNAGVTVAGVKAEQVQKSSVRSKPQQKPIEI